MARASSIFVGAEIWMVTIELITIFQFELCPCEYGGTGIFFPDFLLMPDIDTHPIGLGMIQLIVYELVECTFQSNKVCLIVLIKWYYLINHLMFIKFLKAFVTGKELKIFKNIKRSLAIISCICMVFFK